MKTIYTDKLGLYPWTMLSASMLNFWWAYGLFAGDRHTTFGLDKNVAGTLFVIVGGNFLFLAVKRFRDIQSAKREGRDPTILRIKE